MVFYKLVSFSMLRRAPALPSATRHPAAARPYHSYAIQQPPVSLAKGDSCSSPPYNYLCSFLRHLRSTLWLTDNSCGTACRLEAHLLFVLWFFRFSFLRTIDLECRPWLALPMARFLSQIFLRSQSLRDSKPSLNREGREPRQILRYSQSRNLSCCLSDPIFFF